MTTGPGAPPLANGIIQGHHGRPSTYYVVGELDMSHAPPEGKRGDETVLRAAIGIRTPPRCDHCETVCRECAESWLFDWTFRFDRTAGGRRLREELGGEEALAEMAVRRIASAG